MDKSVLFYQVAAAQSNEQDERRRHFDTVSAGILGLSGALVSFLVLSSADWVYWSIVPFAFALTGFGGVATATTASLWLRKWHLQPPLSDLYQHAESGQYEVEDLVIWTGKQIMSAVEHNEKPLRTKALWLRVAYVSLTVEVLGLAAFVFSVSA